MSRDLPKTRLRRAMVALGPFYGKPGAGGVEISSLPPGTVNTLYSSPFGVEGETAETDETAVRRLQGTFDAICGLGESTPTMAAIAAENIDMGAVIYSTAGPMLIFPDESDEACNNLAQGNPTDSLLSEGYGKPAFQGYGAPKNGTHYTSADFMPKAAKAKSDNLTYPLCSVIQIFPPVAAPNHSQTDVADLFLNGMPTAEMNLCVPYLEVAVLSQFNPGALVDDTGNRLNPAMSTQRWLLGQFNQGSDDAVDPSAAISLHNAQWDGLPNGPYDTQGAYSTEPTIDGHSSGYSTAGAMDLFTWPQTLVNANRNSAAYNQSGDSMAITDPFRPFMSVMSFKTKIDVNSRTESTDAGGGGITCVKNEVSSLRLRLHDRSRMSDAAGLISPQIHNSTQLLITYGWDHPHNLEIARKSDAETVEKFGDILGAMKVTKVFEPKNIRFSFEDSGEVTIDLDLSSSGLGMFKHLQQITSTPADQDSPIDSYQELIRQVNSVVTSGLYTTTTGAKRLRGVFKSLLPQVTSESTGYVPQTAEVKEAVAAFLKKTNETGGVFDAASLTELEALFARHEPGQAPVGARPTGLSALTALLQSITQTGDPFLRPKTIGNNHSKGGPPPGGSKTTSYISLGKIIQYFIVNPLKVTQNVSEIQTIFYSCNASAGAAYDYNLASFPIHFPTFKNKILRHMKKQNNLSVEDFATYLTTFLRDETAGGYGRTGADAGITLGKIYDPDSPPPGTFVPINLNILPVSVPGRDTVGESGRLLQPILKIHVYDAACQDGGQRLASDMYRGLTNSFVFEPTRRNPSADRSAMGADSAYPYASNHGHYYEKAITQFENLGMLTKIEPSKIGSITGISTSKLDEVAENYRVITPDLVKLKNLVSQVMPTIIYGSANTAIERLQVQTITNAATKNLRQTEKYQPGTPEDQADKARAKSPTVNYNQFPVQVQVETLGCPYINHSQQYFLDIGTNTDVDGVYSIHEVEHTVEPGSFKTSFQMRKTSEMNRDMPIDASIKDILAAFAANL